MRSGERAIRRRAAALLLAVAGAAAAAAAAPPGQDAQAKLRAALKKLPWRIVYESYRDGDWDLHVVAADGSGGANLTKNPAAHELFPHASPDGTKVCFVVDKGAGREKVRSVCWMNADGTGRTVIADHAREPCWGPDGRTVLYARDEYTRFTYNSYGTKGLSFYDVATGRHRPHANAALLHLCYLCWSPKGRWIFATVHGGMGFRHGDVAIEAGGKGVFRLKAIGGCRIDVSRDGTKVLWNASDRAIVAGDLDLSAAPPKVTNVRTVVRCDKDHKVYHGDFSPDGRHVAFSFGPNGSQHVGIVARGWRICVADAAKENVYVPVTREGVSNKEPDWLPAPAKGARK